ncbi:hypothetical protein BH09BAC1_BH09BAC1_27000 [soil metagenome]
MFISLLFLRCESTEKFSGFVKLIVALNLKPRSHIFFV